MWRRHVQWSVGRKEEGGGGVGRGFSCQVGRREESGGGEEEEEGKEEGKEEEGGGGRVGGKR